MKKTIALFTCLMASAQAEVIVANKSGFPITVDINDTDGVQIANTLIKGGKYKIISGVKDINNIFVKGNDRNKWLDIETGMVETGGPNETLAIISATSTRGPEGSEWNYDYPEFLTKQD